MKRGTQGAASSLRSRKMFLEVLHKADGWVNVETIAVETYVSRLNIVNAFVKMNAIETKPGKGDTVMARITMYGRELLSAGRFTYADAVVNIGMQRDVYEKACTLAEELGMIHRAGPHAGKRGSIMALVRAVTNRSGAFKKWYKSNYAEELSNDDSK